jgi:hypothetical protein
MAPITKNLWERGFKIYFAFCLLVFTLLIVLINVTRVFAFDAPPTPLRRPWVETPITVTPAAPLPKNFYHWNLPLAANAKLKETYVEFHGNKMFFKVNF